MKFLPFVWAGLWRKPLRTTLTMLALVVAFILFGLLQGINAGFNQLLASSRMDRIFVVPRFGMPMPLSYKAQIAQLPGVKSIASENFINGALNGDPKQGFFVGLDDDVDAFFAYFSEFNTTPAQIAELHSNRQGVIISRANAERWKVKVGDRVHIKSQVAKADGSTDWEFEITGIIDREDLPGLAGISVMQRDYVNEQRASGKDMVNQFMIVMSDPNLSVSTAQAIDDLFINSPAPTRTLVEKLIREDSDKDNNIPRMVNAIVLSTLFALLLMTSNSLMQAFRERIPELGTLKALGFEDRKVLWIVVAEAVVQCIIGAIVGLAIARALIPYAKKLVTGPAGFMTMPWSLVALGLGVAAVVAVISAAVPAWRAARMEIVNALAAR